MKKGSTLGGALLIAGSCIGAGMLGLPIATGLEGFFPSLLMFAVACFFMTLTALLIVEVNSWYKSPVNFITMVSDILGPFGRLLCWITYLILFYALLVAYIAGSGNHFTNICHQFLGFNLPTWVGSVFFVIFFGYLVFLGTKTVDHCNRALMFVKIIAYLGLITIGMSFVEFNKLEYIDFKYMAFSLPILVISFGFHNMIPTLIDYLGSDIKRVKKSIISGALFALVVYLFWQVIVLGTLPIKGDFGILSNYKRGQDAAVALNELLDSYWIRSFSTFLAFFAILTSFLAQSLSLVHFLSDGMKVKKGAKESISVCALALLPPLVFAIIYPQIFYMALNFAGGVCAVILFGVFPALMVWLRREKEKNAFYQVFGGKGLLVIILIFASFIFINQISQTFGYNFFPTPL